MVNQLRRNLLSAGGILAGISMLSLNTANAGSQVSLSKNNPETLKSSDAIPDNFHLNAEDVQFIFADMQPSLVNTSITNPPKLLSGNAGSLARVASILSLPMLFLTVTQEDLVPELQPYATPQNTIFRTNADPFQVQKIVDTLAANKRKTLIVAGYTTEVAVLLSALGGLRNNYNVHIVVDCSGSRSLRTESASLAQATQAGAVQTSVLTVAAQLAPEFSREPGKSVLATIFEVMNR